MLDEYPISSERQYLIDIVSLVCYGFFVIEMIVKMLGLGIKEYILDKFNLFDFILILLSTTDIIILYSIDHIDIDIQIKVFLSLRAIRVLRIIKIAKQLKPI